MSLIKIALISIHGEEQLGKSLHYYNPLSVTTLAGYTQSQHIDKIDLKIFDTMVDPFSKILKELIKFNPSLTGISAKTDSLSELTKIVRTISSQKTLNNMKIVLGGISPTIIYKEILSQFPDLYIIRGEGEYPFSKLIENTYKKLPLNNLPSLIYKDSQGKTIKNKPHNFPLEDLNFIPTDHLTKEVIKSNGDFWLESSRGCNMNCSFCSKNAAHHGNTAHRRFPLSRTIKIIENTYKKFGITNFRFADEDFINDDFNFVDNFCKETKELNFPFTFEIDAGIRGIYRENDTEEIKRRKMWKNLKDSGLRHIFIGIESLSDSQLKRYKKGITVELIIKALEKLNISYAAGFIPLDPFVTVKELKENFVNLKLTGIINHINTPIKFMRVQKGTLMAKMTEKAGLITGETKNSMCYTYRFKSRDVENICKLIKKSLINSLNSKKLNYLLRPTATFKNNIDIKTINYLTLKNSLLKIIELDFLIELTECFIDSQKVKEIENIFIEKNKKAYKEILKKSNEINDTKKREKLQNICEEFLKYINPHHTNP